MARKKEFGMSGLSALAQTGAKLVGKSKKHGNIFKLGGGYFTTRELIRSRRRFGMITLNKKRKEFDF